MVSKVHNSNLKAPRFNEALALRAGVIATAAIGVALLASIFFIPSEIEVVGRGDKDRSAIEQELVRELELLRGAWDPKWRKRILDKAPIRAQEFAGPLNRILRMRSHRLIEQAVEYAGALGELDLRDAAAKIATSPAQLAPSLRTKAMKATEQLGRWDRDQLADFVALGTPPVQLAALEICSQRRDAPWPEILELLTNADDSLAGRTLSDAAIQAIPEHPPEELAQALWDMVVSEDTHSIMLGLRAIRRTKLDAAMGQRLAGLLGGLDPDAQLLCLDLLGSTGKPLGDSGPVWNLVQEDVAPRIRARALYCLEQTRSFEVQQVREQVFNMDPLAKYFAARCLIAADQRDGPDILLDLVDTDETDLSVASRRLLAWLTGRGPGTSRDGFRNSLPTAIESHGKRRLPAPGYDFDQR